MKIIRVTVKNGCVVDVVGVPAGVQVIVRDDDVGDEDVYSGPPVKRRQPRPQPEPREHELPDGAQMAVDQAMDMDELRLGPDWEDN